MQGAFKLTQTGIAFIVDLATTQKIIYALPAMPAAVPAQIVIIA